MKFSVIVPVYNASEHLPACIESLLKQRHAGVELDILIIDDCSTDCTLEIAQTFEARAPQQLRTLHRATNGGPGAARNIGLDEAVGDWIMFVDGDDLLESDALLQLCNHLAGYAAEPPDLVAYDWHYFSTGKGGRYDFHSLVKPKEAMLKDSLSLGMDGSVVYTLMRRDFLEEHHLRFETGYHEDVAFLFKALWHARKITSLRQVLYSKRDRGDSIVNTISRRHIEGYINAYRDLHCFISEQHGNLGSYGESYLKGITGILATRARSIYQSALTAGGAFDLYSCLFEEWRQLQADLKLPDLPKLTRQD